MAKRRRYTDRERVDAVLAAEASKSVNATAQRLGIPESTLRSWINAKNQEGKPQRSQLDPEVYEEKRGSLVDALIAEAWGIIDMMPEKRGSADLRALGTVLGIIIDKVQLLTGEPTEHHQQRIIVERQGIDTLPPHLASGASKDSLRA